MLVGENEARQKLILLLTDESAPVIVLSVLSVSWGVLSPSLSLSELLGEEQEEEEGEETGE